VECRQGNKSLPATFFVHFFVAKKMNTLTVIRAKKEQPGHQPSLPPNNPIHPKHAYPPKINFIHKAWQNNPLPTPKTAD
jgi:hypothetical protein